MKQVITSLAVIFLSTVTFAHPGGHTLTCKSASNSGSKQVIQVSLTRSNAPGWFAPVIDVTLDGKKFEMTTPNEMKTYGDTTHDSPLGVIVVKADNSDDQTVAVSGSFSVVAIPNTVKAFDTNGNLVKWDFKAEKDECSDSNGKAKFQGIIRGYIDSNKTDTMIDTQILDCELTYDSGMAC